MEEKDADFAEGRSIEKKMYQETAIHIQMKKGIAETGMRTTTLMTVVTIATIIITTAVMTTAITGREIIATRKENTIVNSAALKSVRFY